MTENAIPEQDDTKEIDVFPNLKPAQLGEAAPINSNKDFWNGLTGALILFVVGFIERYYVGIISIFIVLILAGISAIFYALGSHAFYKSKGLVLTGVVVIFGFLNFSYFKYNKTDYAYFRITGVSGASVQVSSGRNNFLGAIDPSSGDYDFVAFSNLLSSDVLTIRITDSEGAVFQSTCVEASHIRNGFGSGQQEIWQYRRARGLIETVRGSLIASSDCGGAQGSIQNDGVALAVILNTIMSSAHAADNNTQDISKYIANLRSPLVDVRGAARLGLVSAGRVAIDPMLAVLRDPSVSSGIELDLITAFGEMVRINSALTVDFEKKLTDEDIHNLISISAKSDNKTLRISTVELLASMYSSRIYDSAAYAASRSDPGSRDAYNFAYIAKENAKAATKEQKAKYQNDFNRLSAADSRVKNFTNTIYK